EVRAATDVERVAPGVRPVLHDESRTSPGEAADEHHRPHLGLRELERVCGIAHRKRAVSVEYGVAGCDGFLDRVRHLITGRELRKEPKGYRNVRVRNGMSVPRVCVWVAVWMARAWRSDGRTHGAFSMIE